MTKSLSDIEADKDDATGEYQKFKRLKYLTEQEILELTSKNQMHLVHHVDMDAILTGREKRLTIEQSMHRGAELCVKFVEELKTHQSDKQTVEVKEKEGFTRDDTIEF